MKRFKTIQIIYIFFCSLLFFFFPKKSLFFCSYSETVCHRPAVMPAHSEAELSSLCSTLASELCMPILFF